MASDTPLSLRSATCTCTPSLSHDASMSVTNAGMGSSSTTASAAATSGCMASPGLPRLHDRPLEVPVRAALVLLADAQQERLVERRGNELEAEWHVLLAEAHGQRRHRH